ncbi:HNH endonuclease signature motif containing protein [Yersinia massiliensis]|uniref:HNH nuclease domain-containing protein n=1 Tax=Yersinia massiliensis TaxID=419257 RepID=A0ABM6US04_9GAMM|nr:HNH endonuclease signature motif containing protein [Yersinia massiliensis]AVX37811.1 hypothetical protein DA391_09135 [Yersinia massiliensis]
MKHKPFTYLVEQEGRMDWALLKEALKYNPETGNFTSALHSGVKVRGMIAENGYLKVSFNKQVFFAHRLAWFYVHGKWPTADIDHINGNPSDNRLCNLREATRARNTHNQRLGKSNTSGARCVSWSRNAKRWVIQITRFGHRFNLGTHADKEKAIEIANEFLRKSDGEFFTDVTSRHNLPQDRIALLALIKKSRDVDPVKTLEPTKRIWASHMLSGWGKWAYSGLEGKTQISPIGRFMESVSGRGAITADGIVAIIEGLHDRGYSGGELINKLAQIIASLKHTSAPEISDEEGMFMDRVIMKTLGAGTPLMRVAVDYFVYGHRIETISQYLIRITSGALTPPQARDRIRWCIRIIEAKIYNSIHRELEMNESNQKAA